MDAPARFTDPERTLDGQPRAHVALGRLDTLWFNTGTLCNLACANCYIESSPRNDALVYLSATEVGTFLDEIESARLGTEEIGFTGGEPFMNPELPAMLDDALMRGFRVLVLTNAMRPMMKQCQALLSLRERFGERLELRVSLDHYAQQQHESERGPRSWKPTLTGIRWLAENDFNLSLAGRTYWGEPEAEMRAGYRRLLAAEGIDIDCDNPARLVLFPEMDEAAEVPEITTACWDILGKRPDDMMCANSRMVVKRRGQAAPCVVACTLLPYDERFEMGETLQAASGSISLNHPHCAKFCVLGGGACSVKED